MGEMLLRPEAFCRSCGWAGRPDWTVLCPKCKGVAELRWTRAGSLTVNGKPLPVQPFIEPEWIEKLRVRRRWWNRPRCWIRRRHLYDGGQFRIVSEANPSIIVEQACACCGKSRFTVGVDCA